VVVVNLTRESSSPSQPARQQLSEVQSTGNDEAAKRELKKLDWVKDVYVSPGHMNVGVIHEEKQWSSPMIGNAVCGVLRRTGSRLTRVRFVDIEEVAYRQKTAQAAEISVFDCP